MCDWLHIHKKVKCPFHFGECYLKNYCNYLIEKGLHMLLNKMEQRIQKIIKMYVHNEKFIKLANCRKINSILIEIPPNNKKKNLSFNICNDKNVFVYANFPYYSIDIDNIYYFLYWTGKSYNYCDNKLFYTRRSFYLYERGISFYNSAKLSLKQELYSPFVYNIFISHELLILSLLGRLGYPVDKKGNNHKSVYNYINAFYDKNKDIMNKTIKDVYEDLYKNHNKSKYNHDFSDYFVISKIKINEYIYSIEELIKLIKNFNSGKHLLKIGQRKTKQPLDNEFIKKDELYPYVKYPKKEYIYYKFYEEDMLMPLKILKTYL